MTRSNLNAGICRVLLLLLCLTPFGVKSASAETTSSSLKVSDAWMRAMPPGTTVAAGYLSLHNTGSRPVRIVSLRSPLAKGVEVHQMRTENGQMQMRQITEVVIEPGKTLQLAPGGLHLMFVGVNRTIALGENVAVTLTLGDGAQLDLKMPVRDSAPDPDDRPNDRADDGMHQHHQGVP